VAALGVHWVNLLFYLTLTMMLGTFLNKRGIVIGIPLAFLVAEFGVMMFFPDVGRFLPWVLAIPPDNSKSIAMSIMTGTEPLTWLPIITAIVASVLFTVIALWAFERQEL
jgi:multisubunit Na+/H+ antiporter MnhC subunit